MIEASTKRCTRAGFLSTKSRRELRGLFDRKRLRRHVALHGALLVGEERLRIESVWLDLRILKSVVGFEPLVVARHALLGDEQRQIFQIGEFLDALIGMRNQHLRVFLE